MLSLLITLIIAAIIFWLVYWILSLLPIPQPFKTIILVILGIIALIYLFGILFGFGGLRPVA